MPEPSRRQRILFITTILGVMAGVCAYLVVKAIQQERFALLAVLPAVALTAVPMIRSLRAITRDD